MLVLAQKIVSKAEGRLVDLAGVTPSPRALDLAEELGEPPGPYERLLSDALRGDSTLFPRWEVIEQTSGKWIVECAELFGIGRREIDPVLRNVAVHAQFEGVPRRDGDEQRHRRAGAKYQQAGPTGLGMPVDGRHHASKP